MTPSYLSHTFALAISLALTLSACSRNQPEEAAGARITPEIASQDAAPVQAAAAHFMLNAELNAGGVPSRYEAHFTQDQLVRIDEARTREGEPEAGVYEFYGARLLKYEGAGLTSTGRMRLELDLQGRVTTALADDAPASAQEISAIRERAQLLRSHALSQRATRSHETGPPATPAH